MFVSHKRFALAALIGVAAAAGPVLATDFQVKPLNSGAAGALVFEPTANLAEAQGVTQPGLARGRMQAILTQVAALPESTPASKTVIITRRHKSKAV